MNRQSASAIRLAIRDCLDYCERSRDVLAGLAHCMNTLRSKGWAQEDIRVVEQRVLRILKNLIAVDNPEHLDAQQRTEQTAN